MKYAFVSVAVLVSGLASGAAAQQHSLPSAPVPQANIAVIAYQEAVGGTNEFQRAAIDLRKKFEPKVAVIKNLNNEIDDLEKQLKVQGDALSDTERATRTRNIDEKKRQLQQLAEDSQQDFEQQMGQLYSTMAAKVYKVLVDYAKQKNFTVVLDAASREGQAAPFIFYAQPATNITKAITDAYNLKSGVPAPPSEPDSEAPKPPVAH